MLWISDSDSELDSELGPELGSDSELSHGKTASSSGRSTPGFSFTLDIINSVAFTRAPRTATAAALKSVLAATMAITEAPANNGIAAVPPLRTRIGISIAKTIRPVTILGLR